MAALSTTQWQKIRAIVLAQARRDQAPCALCGGPIDYTLTGRHRAAPSVDHIVERARGGDPYDPANCRPCHNGCNSRRGAAFGNRRRHRTRPTATPSRNW